MNSVLFYFCILKLRIRISIILYVIVILSHDHISQEKAVEDSKRNNVIITYLTYVDLINNT